MRNPSRVSKKLPIESPTSDKDKFTDNTRIKKLADKGGKTQQKHEAPA